MAEAIGMLGAGIPSMRPVFDLEARLIVGFHDRFLAGEASVPQAGSPDVWRWIEENHRSNSALWREEDKARRNDVPDAQIVGCKRSIDALNQRRNDAVEALDNCILLALGQLGG